MIDFVFPNGNEEGFIKIASKLGYDELCFVYKPANEKENAVLKEKINKLQVSTKIKLLIGVIRNNLRKQDVSYALLASSNNNQAALEKGNFDILYNTEKSVLNHVLCKLANKNNVTIGFSFSNILKSHNKAKLISNTKANLRLCKKYKAKVIFASFASDPFEMRGYHDLKSFFEIITR